MVISSVAEQAPERPARLVDIAAHLPTDGQSLYQRSQTDAVSKVGRHGRPENPQAYSPTSIAPEGLVDVFCADCSAADQAALAKAHRPEAVPQLGTPVQLAAERFGRVPRVYVHTLRDHAVSHALHQRVLKAAGGAQKMITLDTSHMPMWTKPQAVADAIAAAVP